MTLLGADPARPATGVTLDNWQTAPALGWSFQHIAELFPTASISRGTGPVAELAARPTALGTVPVLQPDGTTITVADVLAATETDGWLYLHDGVVLAEEYPAGMTPDTLHLLMSVSKSLIGTVAGALAARGVLAPEALVSYYVPELETSGYAGATVRNLLDMRSGIAFSEDYLDPDAEVRQLDQAIGWAPRRHPGVPHTMHEFLTGLRQRRPHGGPFEYRSGESDVLGWVCEAAAGTPMPQLLSELVWARLGTEYDANIGVDSAGTGMFDGGISAALRDLARFGAMLLREGESLTGAQVLPAPWVQDAYRGGPDSRAAFAAASEDYLMPGGMYRSQFWVPFPDRDVLLCLGIHGQMIYVNPAARAVAVKLSSWPTPQHAWKLFSTLRAFDAIAAHVTG